MLLGQRDPLPATRPTQNGQFLIALRHPLGLTQRELAERLGVNEPLVSHAGRNEDHGITVERGQRIRDARDKTVSASVEERPSRV